MDRCESIIEDFQDTINTVQSINSNIKIVVSSVIPRKNDRLMNDMTHRVNLSLINLCNRRGLYFLNNDNGLVTNRTPNGWMYRDDIHLNTKGGKVLGENMRRALNIVLGISPRTVELQPQSDNPHFHEGRYPGRRMMNPMHGPVPPHWMDSRFQWVVPGPVNQRAF